MQRDDFFSSCHRISEAPTLTDDRAITYHASYPALLQAFAGAEPLDVRQLIGLCVMVYGWMPRIVRVDLDHLDEAVQLVSEIRRSRTLSDQGLTVCAALLSSVVGASKLLHFFLPDVIPIWDSRIEQKRLGRSAGHNHMSKPESFLAYQREMEALLTAPWLPDLRKDFQAAFECRLDAHGIPRYAVTDVRMLEYLLFEPSQ